MEEDKVQLTVFLTGADAKLWRRCVAALSPQVNGVRIGMPAADVARALIREGAARLLAEPAQKEVAK